MKQLYAAVFALAALITLPATSLQAQNPNTGRRGTGATGAEPGQTAAPNSEDTIPIPPETTAVTKHDWSANGKTVHYTATAGNLLIRDEKDKANGSIFYTAYTEDGADPSTRPITFFYNGGPGSATIWLRIGFDGSNPRDHGQPRSHRSGAIQVGHQ